MMGVRLVGLLAATICVVCGVTCNREFTMWANNQLKAPFFKAPLPPLTIQNPKRPLYKYMQDAVLLNSTWTSFQMTFTSPYGYLVNAINNASGSCDKRQPCWMIYNHHAYLPKGVYSYIPQPGDAIFFNLTGPSLWNEEELLFAALFTRILAQVILN